MAKKTWEVLRTYTKAPSFFFVENCHDMRATLTQHVVHAQASLTVVLLREFVVRGALLAPTAN